MTRLNDSCRDRATLHHSKLDEFRAYAESQGYRTEPCKGPYEVLRLRWPNDRHPLLFYRRDSGDHATTHQREALRLVRMFVRARRREA